MICKDSADGTGRAYRVHGDGEWWYAVSVPCKDPADWAVIWRPGKDPDTGADEAVITYVGQLRPGIVAWK
jgi:hypothetical protein